MIPSQGRQKRKPKPAPTIEYIEVSEKETGSELNLAFDLLFAEVLRRRNSKAEGAREHHYPHVVPEPATPSSTPNGV
jgi:hypothetical protein